jgi:transglutaminase-like putative cysteine protease
MHLKRPPAGWSSVALVTLMLLCVAWALESQTLNVKGLEVLTYVVLGGVITGLVLGNVDWLPASLAHGWSIVIGIVGATYLATFALSSYEAPATLADMSLLERMALVRTWFFTWLREVLAGGYPERAMASFVFVFAMALLLWLISYVCVWFVVRYVSWWGAVLPSGFALLTALYSSPQRSMIYLVFFLFCALLLATKTHLALQEDRWRRERVGYSADSRFDVLRDGLLVAMVVVAFGWLAPTDVNSGPLRGLVTRLSSASSQMNRQLTRWFPDVRVAVRGAGNSFGNALPLGGSISLNRDPVFDARIAGGPVPRYFRMAVFDRYTGSTWLRQPNAVLDGAAGQMDLAEDYSLTTQVTQTIRPLGQNQVQLYAAPQPERFSLPVRVTVADGPGATGDVLTVESRAPLRVGENEYTVVSRVSNADVDSLRGDTGADPEWVRARYLDVPATVPERVTALAAQVAADSGAGTRFDQASAIEDYLRQIPYSETIGQPPADRDRADWFLFDERRGYCDYYATAFVIMVRSLGIPARFSAGYAVADQPEPSGVYRMRNSDAHTWPEVFFPSYGWVEFEPTAGDRKLDRPRRVADGAGTPTPAATRGGRDADPTAEPKPDDLPPDRRPGGPATSGLTGPGIIDLLARLGLVAAILAAVVGLVAFAWQRPLRGLTVAERAFAQFTRLAGLVGLRPSNVETPYEYGSRVSGAIPEAAGEIHTITDAYVRERFARRPADDQAGFIGGAWARLRGTLLRGGLRLRLMALRRRS